MAAAAAIARRARHGVDRWQDRLSLNRQRSTGEIVRITIFGTGYVGLVTGACLAQSGHHVLCVDIDADKVARLAQGDVPIYEPGLQAMVQSNVGAGRLAFTTDAAIAVAHGPLLFIAVGTPPDEDGSAD